MFVNRYNIHFYDSKSIYVDSVYKANFSMQKQSGNSFRQNKRDNLNKSFSDCFKEAQASFEISNQKSIKK